MSNNKFEFKRFFVSKRQTPVEILHLNICAHFQEIYKDELKKYFKYDKVSSVIKCKRYGTLEQPKIIMESKEILLHKNFVNFLWAYCYGTWVYFEESVMKKALKNQGMPCRRENKKILNRALNLRLKAEQKKLKIWFGSMPRPDGVNLSRKEQDYSLKANSIFLDALSFLLFHEVGHVKFKHFDGVDEREPIDQLQCELDADNFAIEAVVDSENDSIKLLGKMVSAVIAFSAMLFLKEDSPTILFQDKHPDLDTRFCNVLEKFATQYKLDEKFLYYGYYLADVVVRRFYNKHKRFYAEMGFHFDNLEVETSKDLFENDVKILKPKIFFVNRNQVKSEMGFVTKEFNGDANFFMFTTRKKLPLKEKGKIYAHYYKKIYQITKDCSSVNDVYPCYESDLLKIEDVPSSIFSMFKNEGLEIFY